MATPQQVIEIAASQIGVSGTDNKYNAWYWGRPCYDPGTYPWCAAFQSWVADQAGGLGYTPSASVSGVCGQLQRVADEDARAGDYVLYNWDGRSDTSWADHIGLVEWSDIAGSGYFGTIEGNTGSAYGGEVARVTRYNYSSYFTAFYRPVYDGTSAAPPEDPARSVQLYPSNGTDAQRWYPEHNSNGTVSLCNVACGKYLDVAGGVGEAETAVRVYPGNGTEAQQWRIVRREGHYVPDDVRPAELVPVVNGDLRLDVVAGSDEAGAGVWLYAANGTPAQQWYVMDGGDGTWTLLNNASGRKLALDVVGGGA